MTLEEREAGTACCQPAVADMIMYTTVLGDGIACSTSDYSRLNSLTMMMIITVMMDTVGCTHKRLYYFAARRQNVTVLRSNIISSFVIFAVLDLRVGGCRP